MDEIHLRRLSAREVFIDGRGRKWVSEQEIPCDLIREKVRGIIGKYRCKHKGLIFPTCFNPPCCDPETCLLTVPVDDCKKIADFVAKRK